MPHSVDYNIFELRKGNKKVFEHLFKYYYRSLCFYAEGIIGEKEAAGGGLPVRSSKKGELGEMEKDALMQMMIDEIMTKTI